MQINKNGHSIILAAVAAGTMALASMSAKATTISGWDFENYTGADTLTNNPASDLGSVTGTASAIGMTNSYNGTTSVNTDDVITGVTGDTGANGFADLTQVWRVRGQNPGNGWSSQAPIATQGAVFAASTVGYSNITVGFDWYSTKRGEANLELAYTNDGTTWTDVPVTIPANVAATNSVTLVNNSSGSDANSVVGDYLHIVANSGGQQWIPGLTATISDPLAANNPNFAFELVDASTGTSNVDATGAALNNSSGNWRFDNISINGTAVPEPTTLGLAAVAGLGLMARRRKLAK